MRTTNRLNPATSGGRSRRGVRALAGAALGTTLLLGCAGARQLGDTESVSQRRSPDLLATLCNAPGESRVTCPNEQPAADEAGLFRRRQTSVASPLPALDASSGVGLGVAAATLPTEPPATTTVATAAPEPAPAPAAEPAPAPEEAAPEEQPAEEEQPEETAPPTTRKPKKATATTAAPAPDPAPSEAPAPEETTTPTPAPSSVRVDTSVTSRFVALVNAQRAAAGLGPVSASGALVNAAARHSKDQATMGQMTHTGSDGSSPSSRVSAAGYSWRGVAENVAAGQGSVDSAMNSWMNSTGHRANILGSYVNIGVAVAWSASGTPYWTMVLAA